MTRFRPDIEGLRAIAVLPVILYHFKIGFPGGFVGVDVFFVISGFLITSLIAKDMAAGSFSMVSFWERRVRRILPALVTVLMVTAIVAYFLLLPADFIEFGDSIVAQTGIASNLFFWKTAGYFAREADLKPLLHTWSLAVEEQYYLFFPMLWLLLVRSKSSVRGCLALLAFGSLALSVYGAYHAPRATFYLLPARAWELALGAMLALWPQPRSPPKWVAEIVAWLGMALLLMANFLYGPETTFPGLAAVPPCLGTAMLIWSGESSLTSIGRLLQTRPLMFVGANSYSMYLWHWPILVFCKYWSLNALPIRVRLAGFFLTLGLAILTGKLVEAPIRQRRFLPGRAQLFSAAAASMVVLLASGLLIRGMHGMPGRFPREALAFAAARDEQIPATKNLTTISEHNSPNINPAPFQGSAQFLLWGDSHALSVLPVLDALAGEFSVRGLSATYPATAPILDLYVPSEWGLGARSLAFTQNILRNIQEHGVRTILLVFRWNAYQTANYGPTVGRLHRDLDAASYFEESLAKTVRTLRASGCDVWIMAEVPTQRVDVPHALARAAIFGGDVSNVGISKSQDEADNRLSRQVLQKMSALGARILDPRPILRNASGFYPAQRENHSLYRDTHHITRFAAMQLRPMFEPMFQEMLHPAGEPPRPASKIQP